LLTPLLHGNAGKIIIALQRCAAFISGFTSEKLKLTIQKKFISQFVINTVFFNAHMPILVRCKTKGAVGAMSTFLRNWQLGA
jgi:hypothetical protein